jgi:beta-N-acetylhexosaminidase
MDAQRGIARRTVVGLPQEGLDPAWERDFSAYPPAGVIVFRRDFRDLDDLRRLTQHLRGLARPRRLFIGIDEEGGFVSQLKDLLTVPPNALLLARGAAPGDIEWASRVTGERLRALGVDWVFAPVADVHSEPRNPVIGPRAFGADPAEVAACVAEALRGYRASGVASCLKHFPGHGDTVVDSHHDLPVNPADPEVLERRELVPFRANLDADAVMSAHVVTRAIDPERPGTFSRAVVHGLLRERLGFDGVCVTDALEMKGANAGRGPFEVARMALEAGCDLLLFAFHDPELRRVRLELARALTDGAIDRESFDAARPRLARLDATRPEPTAAELARPLESLTPAEWPPRLERIVERGLIVRGTIPPGSGPWHVDEPESASGPSMRERLAGLGVTLADEQAAAAAIVFENSRKPIPEAELEGLRMLCRRRPTALVGLMNDSWLDDLPEAVLRISAADDTPLTRGVVARALAAAITSGRVAAAERS